MFADSLVTCRSDPRWTIALAAVLAAGCMDGKVDDDTAAEADSSPGDDSGADDTARDTGGYDAVPTWRRLSAEVLVEDGAAVADESSLEVTVLGPEADGFPEVCSGTWPIASLTAATSPDDAVLGWWTVTPGQGEGTCETGALPAILHLGVGVLHPDVAALLGVQGWTGPEDVLYGAYVRLPDPGDLWTFGYAWTREAVDAGTPAGTTPPLPDGAWQIVPVYLLPV